MLRASDLHSGYDGVTVIKGVSLEVENEIFAVLGAISILLLWAILYTLKSYFPIDMLGSQLPE